MNIQDLLEKAKSKTKEGEELRAAIMSGSKMKWVQELKAAFDADPQVIAWRKALEEQQANKTLAAPVASSTPNAKTAEPATTKKSMPLMTKILIAAITLVVVIILGLTLPNLGGGTAPTPAPEGLPPGFGEVAPVPTNEFGLPLTPTIIAPPGFGTNAATTTIAGKFAIICYSPDLKTCPTYVKGQADTYLDKHIGSPNAAISSTDPGFANNTYGKIVEVRANATEESGEPYTYSNELPNHGEPSSACLFQPVDKPTGAPIGQPAWVACGGLIIQ